MGQQQGKERSSGSLGGLGSGPGNSNSTVNAAGGTVDRHGSSIRNKSSSSSNKARAATVSAAATTAKERGILGSNIFTEHNGKEGHTKNSVSCWRERTVSN